MKVWLAVPALLVIFGVSVARAQEESGSETVEVAIPDDGYTITNGRKAPRDAFPGAVKLSISGKTCSGTLVAPRLILTAAHCIVDQSGALRKSAIVEFVPLSGAYSPDQRVSLNGNSTVHPAYNRSTKDGVTKDTGASTDIALIRLRSDAPQADRRVTQLARPGDLTGETRFYVTGYGKARAQKNGKDIYEVSRDLMFMTARIRAVGDPDGVNPDHDSFRDASTSLYSRPVQEGDYAGQAVNLCHGDSGGGTFLVLGDDTNVDDLKQLRLVGVNSRIDRGPYTFREPMFNDFTTVGGKKVQDDPDKCLAPGVGSIVNSVPANFQIIVEMAERLGVAL